MSAEAPAAPTADAARAGYSELVRILTRSGGAAADGLRLGDPKRGVLVGLTLDNAAPVFVDPWALDPPVLGIMGDPGTGRRFAAELIRLRASWARPGSEVDVSDAEANRVPRWPAPGAGPHRRAVVAVLSPGGPMAVYGSDGRAGWPFRGLLLRMAVPPAIPSLRAPELEWLARARLPREAGYAEGLLLLGRIILPIAVVASTPEYEYLTARLGPATVPATGVSA